MSFSFLRSISCSLNTLPIYSKRVLACSHIRCIYFFPSVVRHILGIGPFYPFLSSFTHNYHLCLLTSSYHCSGLTCTPPFSCISNIFLFCVLDSSTFHSQHFIPVISLPFFPDVPLNSSPIQTTPVSHFSFFETLFQL